MDNSQKTESLDQTCRGKVLKAAGIHLSGYRHGEDGFSDLTVEDIVAQTGLTSGQVRGALGHISIIRAI